MKPDDPGRKHTTADKRPREPESSPPNPKAAWRHAILRWNGALGEWFCTKCGRSSDQVTVEDAHVELAQFECRLPYVETSRPGQ
jgi:hypothetical protein